MDTFLGHRSIVKGDVLQLSTIDKVVETTQCVQYGLPLLLMMAHRKLGKSDILKIMKATPAANVLIVGIVTIQAIGIAPRRIEFIPRAIIELNPLQNSMVPTYEVVHTSALPTLISRLGLENLEQLPIMLRTDPICIYSNFPIGTVLHILEYDSYRIVRAN